jgi:hypothetical protein
MPPKRRSTIGQRRSVIQILNVADSPFADFSVRRVFTTAYTLRARVRQLTGFEQKNGIATSEYERTHIITFRYSPAYIISSKNMVKYNGDYYKITSIEKTGSTIDDPRITDYRLEVLLDSNQDGYENPAPEEDVLPQPT